jgi:hypothetical protein
MGFHRDIARCACRSATNVTCVVLALLEECIS